MWLRSAPGTFDTKLFAFVISLDKSSEEADSTKEEAAKMEKEYEVSKDSTKNEGQNAAGNSEESGGTGYCFSYYVCSKWLESFPLFGIDFPQC